ncbi:MAG: membrane protein insertion efficiency factor YidD [Actinobacteria bacterium]|nr:membrane protein insertion efficiency factor YidD [Actinomycetota bacterium]NDI09727.1 membrane protein insertion efficiency factor YidD [Actinomycetota bacterium]
MSTGISRLINFYQKFVSPAFAPRCKYYPSCSQYTLDALRGFGIQGALLGLWRLLRCNPFSHGGVDYIPSSFLGKSSTITKPPKMPLNQSNSEVSV